MGDFIEQLPVDDSVPSHGEIQVADMLFKQNKGTISKIVSNLKEVFVAGAIFVILSLPFIDSLCTRFIPSTEKSYMILLIIKTLLFMILFFIINNFYLSRK